MEAHSIVPVPPEVPIGSGAVAIRGAGIAARCCEKLLSDAGLPVLRQPAPRFPRPALLLSDVALALVRDCLGRPDLLAGRPAISRRVVSWGGRDPVTVDHRAIMLAPGDLEEALGNEFAAASARAEPDAGSFVVHTTPPFPDPLIQRFGQRRGHSIAVALRHVEDRDACWMEAVEEGWLFLLPGTNGQGWLLSVGAEAEALLGQSRHIAPRIEADAAPGGTFETAPALLDRISGGGWLACGPAAIAFDPICGDGTAQAVREAILAAATIVAILEGDSAAPLLDHYQAMLLAAMRRHLRLSADFYATGGDSRWWKEQSRSVHAAYDWCTARLARYPEPAYSLNGYRLVERTRAA